MTNLPTTYFGGPDKSKNLLRDILIEHINAVPANGNINWLCYYLNDPIILQALIDASTRGVNVELTLDGRPRSPSINLMCINKISQLNNSSIKINVVKIRPLWEYIGIHWHAHLHSKLYYFSHPAPRVLLGSYNPTAGVVHLSEDSINKIGDHSISHNVLVTVNDQETVKYLKNYISNIQNFWRRMFARVSSTHNISYRSKNWTIDFLPRLHTHPINILLSRKDNNAIVKCAISHLKGPGILRPIKIAMRAGKKIELILESSQRRVPNKQLAFLEKHKIKYYQPKLENNCLMHNKFILYKSDQEHCVMFGSFNWSSRSFMLNHEVVACCYDKKIIDAFETRWDQLTNKII
ncbi:MAG: phospholipase D-like domain-containing protein [Gammaproteobacteria bacterium]|nr:phospholipase D-like domain-containing protein [Gammaproteobacteria bacterium]